MAMGICVIMVGTLLERGVPPSADAGKAVEAMAKLLLAFQASLAAEKAELGGDSVNDNDRQRLQQQLKAKEDLLNKCANYLGQFCGAMVGAAGEQGRAIMRQNNLWRTGPHSLAVALHVPGRLCRRHQRAPLLGPGERRLRLPAGLRSAD